MIWTYNSYFSCDSKDVIIILICKTCDNFYLGQTQDFKQKATKHKSDVKNPHNSNCRICSEHPKDCNQAKQIQRLENIKKNDTLSDRNLH